MGLVIQHLCKCRRYLRSGYRGNRILTVLLVLTLCIVLLCHRMQYLPLNTESTRRDPSISNQDSLPRENNFGLPEHHDVQPRRSYLSGRLAQMHKACNSYNISWHDSRQQRHLVFQNLRYIDDHRIIFCETPKVASTSWLVAMGPLAGRKPPFDHIHSPDFIPTLATLNELLANERLHSYFKTIIVRHPFSRITSTYRNKFAAPNLIYGKLGKQIIQQDPTMKTKNINGTIYPSFRQFSRFLITKGLSDSHWASFDSRCSPCLLNYNYIVKVETIDEDFADVVSIIAPSANLTLPRMGPVTNRNPMKIKNEQGLDEILSLTKTERQQLMELYKKDFEVFGYGWDEEKKTLSW